MSREFSIDMIPGGTQTAVHCNQYESGDTWVFALYYDGGRYSIPADAEVSITGTKPDGAAYNIAGEIDDNAVVITVTDQITACAGRSIAEILVESETDGTTLYSANFPLLVEPAAVQGDLSPSEIPAAITDANGNVYLSAEYEISVVDGQLVINGVTYDIEGTGIVSITKTGTAGLVDTYTILLSDGTSTTFTVTNGDASDAKIQGFIEDWLEEHPEATTTVQDGAITLAKLAPDVSAKLTDTDLSYKWVANGYMRDHVKPFQGWAQNVVWDPDLGCAIGVVISGIASHESEQPWHRVTIDKTGYMSQYEEITVYDTDGETAFDPNNGYMGFITRLSDGTYLGIDQQQYIYKSTDTLKTLIKQSRYAFTQSQEGSMFGGKELSNGRIIIGHGGQVNGFWYSDDDGVTWTNVIPDASGLGQQIYPSSGYKPFEPCFIEIGDGKVLAIARKSMTAYGTGSVADAQYAVKEPAVISKSSDYGATWTAWVDSRTITDMTACNGKAVIIGNKVHFVFGSRWKNSNGNNFQLFYTHASLDDAWADNWSEPVVIDVCRWDVSTATNSHDSGYPSVWADENSNLYSVHYDGDGTGSAFGANWRLCTGSPVAKLPALNADGSGSLNVGYTQKVIDKKTNALWAKINEILLLIGQMPDDSGEYDGSSPIYSGLVAWFDVTQESKWDGAVLTSMVGELTATAKPSTSSGQISSSTKTPTGFNNGFADIGVLYFDESISSIVGASVTAFTIEYVVYITGNTTVFYTKTTSQVNVSNTVNPNVYVGKNGNALFDGAVTVPYHVCAVFESGKVTWYVNGVKKIEETTAVAFADILASYPLPNAHQSSSGACLGDVRFYNRALTADEIRNNYLYTQSETDYLTAPTFS